MHIKVSGAASYTHGDCLSVRFGGTESAVLPDSAALNLTLQLTEAF